MRKLPRTANALRIGAWAKPCLVFFALFLSFSMFGQVDLSDGQQAIEEAATGIEEYFDPIRTVVVRLVIL